MAQAYTSPINTQDPTTAPDTYVVNFPDVNLKRALNSVIASAMNEQRRQQGLPQDVVRTDDQAITAGDMKVLVNIDYCKYTKNTKQLYRRTSKINTLKDADKKNTLQAALDQLEQEYATRKTCSSGYIRSRK